MDESGKYLDKHILIKGKSTPWEKEDGEMCSRNSTKHLSPSHLAEEKNPPLYVIYIYSEHSIEIIW